MIYTRKQFMQVVRKLGTSYEVDNNGVTMHCITHESAVMVCTGLAVMSNVRASVVHGIDVHVPFNSSGHTIRAQRAQFDSVNIIRIHTMGDSL
jgi:hypothetical protein